MSKEEKLRRARAILRKREPYRALPRDYGFSCGACSAWFRTMAELNEHDEDVHRFD